MSILIIVPGRDVTLLKNTLMHELPDTPIEVWPEVADPSQVEVVVLWKHPKGILSDFPRLKVICSMGAGVDHILLDESLPPQIPVIRVVDPELTRMMRKYVVMAVTSIHKDIFAFYNQKKSGKWFQDFYPDSDPVIGILGMGELGKDAAMALYHLGYKVIGWSRTIKDIQGIISYEKKDLKSFVNRSNIIVNLLPLTPETRGIMNEDFFSQLPLQSSIINVGRGEHLIEEDLIEAIENGRVKSAILDVFSKEPLPLDHPFWKYDQVIITPHIASITNQENAAIQIAENFKRYKIGQPLINEVDISLGY